MLKYKKITKSQDMENDHNDIARNEKVSIHHKVDTINTTNKEQNKIIEKQNYSPPLLSFEIIELESCIPANSASLSPGSGNDLNTPHVEDWTDQGLIGNQDIDL